MAESHPAPVLKRPPGYKDPNNGPPPLPIQIPRSQIPPPYNQKPKRKRRSCCRCCYCFCCCVILLLIVLLAIFGALFYVWYIPKLPSFHIQSVKTPLFNVTVTPDGTYLNATTDIKFEATNPNTKIDFYYGKTHIRMTVEDDVEIGSVSIPEFTQLRKNTTILPFEMTTDNMLIDDDTGRRLKDRIRNKMMVVNLEVRTSIGIGLEKIKLGKMAVTVICEHVNIKQVDGGETPKCTINLLKWINIS